MIMSPLAFQIVSVKAMLSQTRLSSAPPTIVEPSRNSLKRFISTIWGAAPGAILTSTSSVVVAPSRSTSQ